MDILDLLFPRSCFGCGASGTYVCTICISKLPKIKQVCPLCEKASVDGFTHIRCKKKLGLDGVYSIWPYVGVLRKAFIKLKYKYAVEIAKEIAEHAKKKLKSLKPYLPKDPLLLPIPLYFLKQNYRGFNQAEVLGKEISGTLGWEFFPEVLVRKKLKRSQTGLVEEERRKNIRGVFALNNNCQSIVKDQGSIVLFDDIYTTGSTLKEACKVLKRNGAKSVWGLTVAR